MSRPAQDITTSYSERTVVSRLETWHSRMADGAAVAGLAQTVDALTDGRAAEVLLRDDPGSTATVWTGPGGAELALSSDAMTERGVAEPVRDRADAAIARAIACTDAELFFLPESAEPPPDGIAATLCF